jgi:predicted 2-oxoglutarate/Fe(II)-dependent dioxygenase YbiX
MINTATEYRLSKTIELDQWPLVIENFLSQENLAIIKSFIDNNQSAWPNLASNNFWAGRSLDYQNISDKTVQDIMLTNMNQLTTKIEQHSGFKNLYSDLLQIVRWPNGYELHPHADGENPDNTPHPFPWRLFGSVVYINDDYTGGEIHYPHRGISIKPKPGMLAVHPGTVDFLHGVCPVTAGVRYTIASFFTIDSSRATIKV